VYSLTFFREYDISVDTEEPPQILSFFGEEDFEVISGWRCNWARGRIIHSRKGKSRLGPTHGLCRYEVRRHLCYMPLHASKRVSFITSRVTLLLNRFLDLYHRLTFTPSSVLSPPNRSSYLREHLVIGVKQACPQPRHFHSRLMIGSTQWLVCSLVRSCHPFVFCTY